jgi:hypothetical protein
MNIMFKTALLSIRSYFSAVAPLRVVCLGGSFIAICQTSVATSLLYSPPASGLVSWWRGDGNATDSADGNTGMALNGSAYSSGLFGSAFSFDGHNDHIRVPNSANLQITGNLTLGAWVYRHSTGTFDEIISKWDAVPVNQRSYTMTITPTGQASFGVSPAGLNNSSSALSAGMVPLNTWTHVAGVYDGSSLRVYLNGQSAGQTLYSGGIFGGVNDLSIGGVVGGVVSGSGISFFDGDIDEVVIYNRALSGGELMALATVPEPAMATFLLLAGLFACRRIGRSCG